MFLRIVVVILLAASAAMLPGCKKSGTGTVSRDTAVKSEAEYEVQAQKDINETNMESALNKLETEVEKDTGTE